MTDDTRSAPPGGDQEESRKVVVYAAGKPPEDITALVRGLTIGSIQVAGGFTISGNGPRLVEVSLVPARGYPVFRPTPVTVEGKLPAVQTEDGSLLVAGRFQFSPDGAVKYLEGVLTPAFQQFDSVVDAVERIRSFLNTWGADIINGMTRGIENDPHRIPIRQKQLRKLARQIRARRRG